jgi:hypothetical protein
LVEEKSGDLAEVEILWRKANEVDFKNEQAFFNRGYVRPVLNQNETLSDMFGSMESLGSHRSAYFKAMLNSENINRRKSRIV